MCRPRRATPGIVVSHSVGFQWLRNFEVAMAVGCLLVHGFVQFAQRVLLCCPSDTYSLWRKDDFEGLQCRRTSFHSVDLTLFSHYSADYCW